MHETVSIRALLARLTTWQTRLARAGLLTGVLAAAVLGLSTGALVVPAARPLLLELTGALGLLGLVPAGLACVVAFAACRAVTVELLEARVARLEREVAIPAAR